MQCAIRSDSEHSPSSLCLCWDEEECLEGTKKNVSKFGPKIVSAPPHGSATCARKNVECDQIRVSVSVRACTPSCWCFHNTFRHLCAFLWGSLAMFSYSRSRQKCDHRGVYSTRLALTVRPSRVPRPRSNLLRDGDGIANEGGV